jgi:hypothetical protein
MLPATPRQIDFASFLCVMKDRQTSGEEPQLASFALLLPSKYKACSCEIPPRHRYPLTQDPRMLGSPPPPAQAQPLHPAARDLAQHDLICREAAPLSRSLLFKQQETRCSARANSQASFTPHHHSA